MAWVAELSNKTVSVIAIRQIEDRVLEIVLIAMLSEF